MAGALRAALGQGGWMEKIRTCLGSNPGRDLMALNKPHAIWFATDQDQWIRT